MNRRTYPGKVFRTAADQMVGTASADAGWQQVAMEQIRRSRPAQSTGNMKNMSIGKRIAIGFVINLFIMLALSIFAGFCIRAIHNHFNRVGRPEQFYGGAETAAGVEPQRGQLPGDDGAGS
jgi:hypothetical protein